MSSSKSLVKLTKSEILLKLSNLPKYNKNNKFNWNVTDNSNIHDPTDLKLYRNFKFKTFEDTWAFLTKIAMRSHLTAHHPTIINTYNKVTLELNTHDVNGLTDLDFKLAKRFSDYAFKIGEIEQVDD
ncbi:unnamed protein product [[Candida] boidinii]|uniref:4a-hydroxytetrahydrobiopterin dehydratase n=1 Tax=Candida boidinii TaxID=5477 RepID=A0A9W6SY90_CANBO|nr:unnamed protein product [[Candida] boidinii]GMF08593.1 unnamed protein product [[Candida] boidinii]GMF60281.1 unnamed protein product [[Candida] boidinii]GMG00222.1 unnamed protein product [[Candida] boidinii]